MAVQGKKPTKPFHCLLFEARKNLAVGFPQVTFPPGFELFHHLRKQGNGAPPLLVFWFLHDESPVQGGEALGDGDCPLL